MKMGQLQDTYLLHVNNFLHCTIELLYSNIHNFLPVLFPLLIIAPCLSAAPTFARISFSWSGVIPRTPTNPSHRPHIAVGEQLSLFLLLYSRTSGLMVCGSRVRLHGYPSSLKPVLQCLMRVGRWSDSLTLAMLKTGSEPQQCGQHRRSGNFHIKIICVKKISCC